jgi:hypothetical protein
MGDFLCEIRGRRRKPRKHLLCDSGGEEDLESTSGRMYLSLGSEETIPCRKSGPAEDPLQSRV